MSDSIFSWDDEEEEKQPPMRPAALIPYEPPEPIGRPADLPQPIQDPWDQATANEDPLEIEPPTVGHTRPTEIEPPSFGYPSERTQIEPPSFGYPSDPTDIDPPSFGYSSDPFASVPQPPEEPEPFQFHTEAPPANASQPDHHTYPYNPYAGEPAGSDTYQYPFGAEPEPFAPAEQTLDYEPESKEETARRSGMAFSAGIVFFSSVVFMMFLGWIADLLIGSSPWGLVGGVILGSFLGLLQFVRITSRIFNSNESDAAMRPLLPPDDEQ